MGVVLVLGGKLLDTVDNGHSVSESFTVPLYTKTLSDIRSPSSNLRRVIIYIQKTGHHKHLSELYRWLNHFYKFCDVPK